MPKSRQDERGKHQLDVVLAVYTLRQARGLHEPDELVGIGVTVGQIPDESMGEPLRQGEPHHLVTRVAVTDVGQHHCAQVVFGPGQWEPARATVELVEHEANRSRPATERSVQLLGLASGQAYAHQLGELNDFADGQQQLPRRDSHDLHPPRRQVLIGGRPRLHTITCRA